MIFILLILLSFDGRADEPAFVDADYLPVPLAFDVHIDSLPASKKMFCSRTAIGMAAEMIALPGRHALDFKNPEKSSAGKGLCWWHTRYQRNASYLLNFFPGKKKPSKQQALKIIQGIAKGERVWEVPGYANLQSFSRAYKNEMLKAIDDMAVDSILNLDIISRWGDARHFDASEMKLAMRQIYQKMHETPQFMFLRLKAEDARLIDSHSYLLIAMEKATEETGREWPHDKRHIGYDLYVIDSNAPDSVLVKKYRDGDRGLVAYTTMKKYLVTVRPGYEDEVRVLGLALQEYCR